MAGDWIKMRGNLWDDPRVARICDMTDSGEAAVVGALYWLWSTADQHTEDGCMPGLTLRQIDRKTGLQGFGSALVAIGWLVDDPQGVVIQGFEEHNGASAKKRCQTAQRVAKARSSNAHETQQDESGNAASVTGALAREEKRREEEIQAEPDGSGAEAPTDREVVYAAGIAMLTAAGVNDKNARSFLAMQCKTHGEAVVRAALDRCAKEQPIQPIPWLQAALKADVGIAQARASPAETTYARSMREKYEKVAPGVAARAPGQTKQIFDCEVFDAAPKLLG